MSLVHAAYAAVLLFLVAAHFDATGVPWAIHSASHAISSSKARAREKRRESRAEGPEPPPRCGRRNRPRRGGDFGDEGRKEMWPLGPRPCRSLCAEWHLPTPRPPSPPQKTLFQGAAGAYGGAVGLVAFALWYAWPARAGDRGGGGPSPGGGPPPGGLPGATDSGREGGAARSCRGAPAPRAARESTTLQEGEGGPQLACARYCFSFSSFRIRLAPFLGGH